MKKGKIRNHPIALKAIQPENAIIVTQSPLRFPIIIKIVALIVFIVFLFIIIYKTSTSTFSSQLIPYKEVVVTPLIDYKGTSTMCGCLNDSIAHNGILLAGNNIILERKSSTQLTNYLITAPTPSSGNERIGFSFNAKYYCLIDTDDFEQFAAIDSLKAAKHTYSYKILKNTPYLSIVTPSEIYAHIFGKKESISFIPTDKGVCDIKINDNSHIQQIQNVIISQTVDNRKFDNGTPATELLGDSIALIWKGKPKLLDEQGLSLFIQHFPDTLNYINILIVKAPFATRINALGWSDGLEDFWRQRFRDQFDESYMGYSGDVPTTRSVNGMLEPTEFDKILPATIPTEWYLKDTAIYKIEVNKLLSKAEYDSLYKKYQIDEGIFYPFKKGAYAIGDAVNFRYPPSLMKILKKLRKKQLRGKIQPIEMLDLHHQLKSYLLLAKKDTLRNQKINLDDREMYFRYPPMDFKNGISFFSHFENITLIGSDGEINVDKERIPIDQNSKIELLNLHNNAYQYPSFTMGFENDGELKLSGQATIVVDGDNIVKRNLLAGFFSFIGFLSIILTLLQAGPIIQRLRKGMQFINFFIYNSKHK